MIIVWMQHVTTSCAELKCHAREGVSLRQAGTQLPNLLDVQLCCLHKDRLLAPPNMQYIAVEVTSCLYTHLLRTMRLYSRAHDHDHEDCTTKHQLDVQPVFVLQTMLSGSPCACRRKQQPKIKAQQT